MKAEEMFAMALGLEGTPWKVEKAEFTGEPKRLELRLDFAKGSRFKDPVSKELCAVHDTVEKSWRHLNFWQYETILSARLPRIVTPDGKVKLVEAPWSRPGSGFTLMMEALVVLLCQSMPVAEVAQLLGVSDTRLWRVLQHHVEVAQQERDWSGVRRVLVDETSARRGHRYVTNVVDADTRELLLMVPGRSADALEVFNKELVKHGGTAEQIQYIAMDMSPAYEKGARESFPAAQVVNDKFHIMQLAGVAVDEVRKALRRQGADLAGELWAVRGNVWTRSEEQLELRNALTKSYPKLARALLLRDMLQDALASGEVEVLSWWISRPRRSRLEPFKKLALTILAHWNGVVAAMETGLTNGLVEAINGLLQLAKRMARGFRSFTYFQTMAYLKTAKLKLHLPSLLPT
jgi:transposase